MTDHTAFMKMAIELAQTCIQRPEGRPFGAVVVIDGKVVGTGMNESVLRCDPTAHGEVMAIRDACAKIGTHRLPSGTLYTSSEPCPLCLAAAMWAGITDIYYACSADDAAKLGFSDKAFYDELAKPKEQRKIHSHQLLADEGRAVVEAFYRNRLKGLV
ncbi:MAG TPA: nucleoside deaminase, partial [Tepidisphaeraceae bacterium]|nr:nucleoside deaminase [Tepidisphaeraceae bacterium]